MNKSHLTAISRNKMSGPMRRLVADGLVKGRAMDFGCGRGFDADALGIDSYDPHYNPTLPVGDFHTITCNFVLNVIETIEGKRAVLAKIDRRLSSDGYAYIAVRNDKKSLKGFTSKGTWQDRTVLSLPVVAKTSGFTIYRMAKWQSNCTILQEVTK